jgi:hypothetical protein
MPSAFTTKVNLGKVPLIGGRISLGAQIGLKAGALYLKGVASEYPPVRRLKVDTTKWTIKQRRWFFAALKKGEIEVPYPRGTSRRSERLGARWAVDESKVAQGVAVVGNNASYAQRVYGRQEQSWYHKGNWLNTTQIARKGGPRVRQIMAVAIAGKLEGR